MYQKTSRLKQATENTNGKSNQNVPCFEIVPSWGAAVLRPYMTVPSGRGAM